MSAVLALLFIARRSLFNGVKRQLLRLRQPRYLAASAAGLFYLYGVFARHRFTRGPGEDGTVIRAVSMAVLLALAMLYVLWTWLFGGDEAALSFSEAEIQFLFPAPLTRRALVHYKLLRTVALSAVTALFLTLGLGQRMGLASMGLFFSAWLGTSTLALHRIAVSLTRASLLQHGASGPLRRLATALFPLFLCGAAWAAWAQAPQLPEAVSAWMGWFEQLTQSPWMQVATVLFRPALELALGRAGPGTLPLALGVLAANYMWALASDADFSQGSLALAQKRSRRQKARRQGQLPLRAAKAPFALGATGHPAVAIFWKNLTAAVRLLSLRVAVVLGLPLLAIVGLMLAQAGGDRRPLGALACLMAALYLTVFGSQVYRIDFRLDLTNLDLLRTLPLTGAALAAAEVAAPWVVITAGQLVLIALAALLVPPQLLGAQGRLSATLALALAAPAATLCLVLVQNAGALLFPAWVAAGVQGSRGVEAMGQRLLTLAGTLLAVAVALLPAALLGGGCWLLLSRWLGAAALPLAALVGAAVVAVEAGWALVGLGRLFERADLPPS